MVDEVSRKQLGELLEPMTKLPVAGSIEDRRDTPYAGPQVSQDKEWILRWLLDAQKAPPPNQLQIDAGYNNIRDRPLSMNDLMNLITPEPVKGR